jgi:hypothetical protein
MQNRIDSIDAGREPRWMKSDPPPPPLLFSRLTPPLRVFSRARSAVCGFMMARNNLHAGDILCSARQRSVCV